MKAEVLILSKDVGVARFVDDGDGYVENPDSYTFSLIDSSLAIVLRDGDGNVIWARKLNKHTGRVRRK